MAIKFKCYFIVKVERKINVIIFSSKYFAFYLNIFVIMDDKIETLIIES